MQRFRDARIVMVRIGPVKSELTEPEGSRRQGHKCTSLLVGLGFLFFLQKSRLGNRAARINVLQRLAKFRKHPIVISCPSYVLRWRPEAAPPVIVETVYFVEPRFPEREKPTSLRVCAYKRAETWIAENREGGRKLTFFRA